MKPRHLFSAISCVLAASTFACSGEPDRAPASEESTSTTAQSVMSATGNILIWPAGPITWDGLVGTWPISVWSTGAIGGLAFDTMGLSLTGIELVGMADIAPLPITTPFLNAFTPAAGAVAAPGVFAPPVFGPAGVAAPNYGFAGAFDPFVPPVPAFGFGAFAPGVGMTELTMIDGAVAPGFESWLTPTLTGSALMFTDLTPIDAFTPLTFNVTFTAAQPGLLQPGALGAAPALNLANLSIFATPIAPAALTGEAIPFTSMVYPVAVPLVPMPAAPLAPSAPVLTPTPVF